MYPKKPKWEKKAALSSLSESGHNKGMQASSNVKHYANHSDYLKRAPEHASKALDRSKEAVVNDSAKEEPTEKVELSSKSSKPSLPVEAVASEIPVAAAKMIGEVAMEAMEQKEDPSKAQENGPGVFFISGFRLFGLSSSDGDGLQEMAKFSEEGEHYSWADEDELFEKISQKYREGPLVLVGHSLGANSAVRIANKLNSAEHGFRRVDLLVTMDAFGLDNDIIPENVKKNMNFIGHRNVFLNDGPNIARTRSNTEVMNELRDELHTKIDNAPDIQARIYQNIEGVISRAKNQLDSASSPWRFQTSESLDSSLSKEVAPET